MPVRFRLGLILFWFVCAVTEAQAATRWEVSVLFLGAGEDKVFQQDIDRNLVELSRIAATKFLRVNVLRESDDRVVEGHITQDTYKAPSFQKLFFRNLPDHQNGRLLVDRSIRKSSPNQLALLNEDLLGDFLGRSFTTPQAKHLLIIYSHGAAFDGLRHVPLPSLRSHLETALRRSAAPRLDALWFDACFMGNLEVLFELKDLSDFIVASEEAEFTSANHYQNLAVLSTGPENIEYTLSDLARGFVESYSYTEEGDERLNVVKSSAVMAVFDTRLLDPMVSDLKDLAGVFRDMDPEIKKSLSRTTQKFAMDTHFAVDLGNLLLTLRSKKLLTGETNDLNTRLIQRLELSGNGVRSNARITIRPPEPDALLVYGYDGWSIGSREDTEFLDKLPKNLKPTEFVRGPGGRYWPARPVKKILYLTPFTVDTTRFNTYFVTADGRERLTDSQTYLRKTDYVWRQAKRNDNPVRAFGYTQSIGQAAEKYTGVSILSPEPGSLSLNYVDTMFYSLTHWAQ